MAFDGHAKTESNQPCLMEKPIPVRAQFPPHRKPKAAAMTIGAETLIAR